MTGSKLSLHLSLVTAQKLTALFILAQLISGCGKNGGGNSVPTPAAAPTSQQATAASPTPVPTATPPPVASGPKAPEATGGHDTSTQAPPSATGGTMVPNPVAVPPTTVLVPPAPGNGVKSNRPGDLCSLEYGGKFRDHGDAAGLSIQLPNDASTDAVFKLKGDGSNYLGKGTCEMVSQVAAQFHFVLAANHGYIFQGEISIEGGQVVLTGEELKGGKVIDHLDMTSLRTHAAKGKKPAKGKVPVEPTPAHALGGATPGAVRDLCKMNYRGTFAKDGDAAALKVNENSFTLTGDHEDFLAEGACTQTSATSAIFRFTLKRNKNYAFKGTITLRANGSAELSGTELKAGKVIDHLSLEAEGTVAPLAESN